MQSKFSALESDVKKRIKKWNSKLRQIKIELSPKKAKDDDLIENFTCLICLKIVTDPVECARCKVWAC